MGRPIVTREQWLDAGLERFGRAGLLGLRVEAMAKALGTSKAGFYWYFKSRARFEEELFEHWRARETRAIIDAADAAGEPREKFLRPFTEAMRLRQSSDFLFHLRRLARKRRSLARMLDATEDERMAFVERILVALGKKEAEAREASEAIYHLYLGWYERHQFKTVTPAEAEKLLRILGVLVGFDLERNKGAKP
jgi:AcrR family transcriptional regulator